MIESTLEEFKEQIIKFMTNQNYQPLRRKQLISALKIPPEDHITFRRALKMLKKEGFLSIEHGIYDKKLLSNNK